MATAATVPTRMPATEQARKPGGTRSPAPLRPPAPLKASQLPIIRLAASLGDSLSSDTEKPSDRELMFVSGRRGAVITTLLQDMPHTYARRGAPAAPPDPDRTVGNYYACHIGRQRSRMERRDVAGHQGQLAPLPAACEGPMRDKRTSSLRRL